MAFWKKIYRPLEELQANLDVWLQEYHAAYILEKLAVCQMKSSSIHRMSSASTVFLSHTIF